MMYSFVTYSTLDRVKVSTKPVSDDGAGYQSNSVCATVSSATNNNSNDPAVGLKLPDVVVVVVDSEI